MDDRKKRIDDLFKNNHEAHLSLDTLLENFGENLYARTKNMQAEFNDILQFNAYLQDISDSNSTIGKIEEKNRRFKELEEAIEDKEQEEKEREKELAVIYRRLGKTLLENRTYDDYTSFFREQADTLKAKLDSLETRIGELDSKEGGNVFSWIGKSAQGLVLRSFHSKAQENQEQLYYNVGERFSSRDSVSHDDEVAVILAEIESFRNVSRSTMNALSVLKDEKRVISASFGIDGNPQKQIQNIKVHITHVRDELRLLYRNFGAQSAGIDENIKPERKYFIDTIVTAEDGETIGRAVKLNQSIKDNDAAIAKLKASLAIDEEKIKIEKYKKQIDEKKSKISDLENDIKDLEDTVTESGKYIQELEKQL